MKIYAHRGASTYAPENTLAAFALAYEMGADGIELDVQLTADDEVVVIHDDTLERTSSGVGLVREHSLAELKKLDFGTWFSERYAGEQIPTLAETLRLIYDTGMKVNIELKATSDYDEGRLLTTKTAELIKQFDLVNQVIVSSFNHKYLTRMRCKDPRVATGILYFGDLLHVGEYAHSLDAHYAHPHYEYVDADTVDECRRNDVRVNVWTVDDPKDAKRLEEMGVYGLITNKPDILTL